MDSEFPDPEDEFDLMHEDEYEVLRELEGNVNTQNGVVKNTAVQNEKVLSQAISVQNEKIHSQATSVQNEKIHSQVSNYNSQKIGKSQQNQNGEFRVTAVIESAPRSQPAIDNTRKRSIDDILKDVTLDTIDSIDLDSIDELPTKKRPCWDQPQELMKLILDRRKLHNSMKENDNYETIISSRKQTDFITRRVPSWNFVAITRADTGERFYIKVSDKKHQYVKKSYRPTSNFLIKSFSKLKDEAEKIILRNIHKASIIPEEQEERQNLSCELWVDKYRPKKYLELLSDENVNKSLLYWLKLWDKIVFDRDPTVRARKPEATPKWKNKFKAKQEDIPDHDSKGFPTQRIALLTGPPGLGKTTLAHVAARHAGYNIVELNASDDRGPEAFREALLSSTQMRALIDKEKRPNCLILDEIDGAPAASIDLLLKFIHGKLVPKGRNAKEKSNKGNDGCRRPIICICNDLYTPSLRPLRSMALVINIPEISPSTLAERLSVISRKEGLHVDSRILLQLAERSACDVRACLGILQYTGGKSSMLQSLAFGLKDMRKGLFESWREMLQVPMTRRGALSSSERAQKVIKIVHQGESDRLVQGIFHNYPEVCKDKIIPVSKSLEWFEFYDEVNTHVMEKQSWTLMPYTTSAFVAWHLYLAGVQNPKISYPTIGTEVHQKLERNKAILSITKKVAKIDILTLVSEILPYLPDLLTPKLRSVNVQLYSTKEKQELDRLVNLMLDFGLTFTQEKKSEGGYEYNLDPNIWDIGVFPDCKQRRPLPYAVKQIVIHELETARLRRAAVLSGEENPSSSSTTSKKNVVEKETISLSQSSTDENIPNHLRQLNPIEIKPTAEKKCRNFFAAFQKLGDEKLKKKRAEEKEQGIVNVFEQQKMEAEKERKRKDDIFKSDVWYQYQEGYSNAIRRTVRMKDLIQ